MIVYNKMHFFLIYFHIMFHHLWLIRIYYATVVATLHNLLFNLLTISRIVTVLHPEKMFISQ